MIKLFAFLFSVIGLAAIAVAQIVTGTLTVDVVAPGSGAQWLVTNGGIGITSSNALRSSYATQPTIGSTTLTTKDYMGAITVGSTIKGSGIPGGTTIIASSGYNATLSAGTTAVLNQTPITVTAPFTMASTFNKLSYVGDNVLAFVTSASGTSSVPTNVFLSNSSAGENSYPGSAASTSTTSCSPVPNASAVPGGNGSNVWTYLCSNLLLSGSTWVNAQFSGPANSPHVQYVELSGCGNPCVVDAVNTFAGPGSNGTMSLSGNTSAAGDMVVLFSETSSTQSLNPGSCCATVFNNNHYSLLEYQVAGAPGVYTNNIMASTTNPVTTVLVALKQGSSLMSAPSAISPLGYTVVDNAPVGTVVNGGGTTDTGLFIETSGGQAFTGTISMTASPGGLLSYNPVTKKFATTTSPMTDGTYTGTISATENGVTLNKTVTLNVMPPSYPPQAGNCDASPPPAALRAGYTTLAYCLDFSSAKYAGPPATWQSCDWPKTGTETNYDLSQNYGSFCKDATYWHQGVDPKTGKTVMIFSWHGADCGAAGYPTFGGCRESMQSIVGGPIPAGNIDNGAGWDQPAGAYTEIRWRQDPVISPGGACCSPDFFLWGLSAADTNAVGAGTNPPYAGTNEQDIVEMYQKTASTADHTTWMWSTSPTDYAENIYPGTNGLYNQADITALIPGFSITDPHSYAWLSTTNGALTGMSALQSCAYVDNMLIPPSRSGGENCYRRNSSVQPQAGRNTQNRMYLSLWLGDSNQNYNVYIERIAVWTCANWKNIQPNQSNDTCLANGISQ